MLIYTIKIILWWGCAYLRGRDNLRRKDKRPIPKVSFIRRSDCISTSHTLTETWNLLYTYYGIKLYWTMTMMCSIVYIPSQIHHTLIQAHSIIIAQRQLDIHLPPHETILILNLCKTLFNCSLMLTAWHRPTRELSGICTEITPMALW